MKDKEFEGEEIDAEKESEAPEVTTEEQVGPAPGSGGGVGQ